MTELFPVKASASAGKGGIPSNSRLLSAANTVNATIVKASQGRVYKIRGLNAAAAVRYIKLYDKATAPAATDTPTHTFAVPASAVFDIDFGLIGVSFTAGISYRLTTGAPDNDTGALTAADILGLNVMYM